jgi:hypothetical protein
LGDALAHRYRINTKDRPGSVCGVGGKARAVPGVGMLCPWLASRLSPS